MNESPEKISSTQNLFHLMESLGVDIPEGELLRYKMNLSVGKYVSFFDGVFDYAEEILKKLPFEIAKKYIVPEIRKANEAYQNSIHGGQPKKSVRPLVHKGKVGRVHAKRMASGLRKLHRQTKVRPF